MGIWARLLADIETAIEAAAGLSSSPLPFSIVNVPEQLTGQVFSVLFDSVNTGKARERLYLRPAHTIQVDLLHSYNQCGGRQQAQIDALDAELEIIDALMSQSTFKSYRISWRSSTRNPTATLTHLITTIVFDAEHDLTIVPPASDDL